MNKIFQEYTTSTAFLLQLTKNQCNALLRVEVMMQGPTHPVQYRDGGIYESYSFDGALTVGTLKGLQAKGLVGWNHNENGEACGFKGLTDAGRLVVGLLKEAGMTIESTNTVSVLRRIAA